jgi:integrase
VWQRVECFDYFAVWQRFQRFHLRGAAPQNALPIGGLLPVGALAAELLDRTAPGLVLVVDPGVRRRHRLKTRPGRRRDAPVDAVKDILAECLNARDVLFIAMLATTGLRRGEALGLRLSDLHFLPNSVLLGCDVEGAHLHIVPRTNSNHAKVKNAKRRVVPVPAGLVKLYDRYRADRDACWQAQESDYVFVNLYRAPLGEPMKLHAANELLSRLSRRAGHALSPHMLRHTFGTNAAQAVSLDVVAELLGHANLQSTQTQRVVIANQLTLLTECLPTLLHQSVYRCGRWREELWCGRAGLWACRSSC